MSETEEKSKRRTTLIKKSRVNLKTSDDKVEEESTVVPKLKIKIKKSSFPVKSSSNENVSKTENSGTTHTYGYSHQKVEPQDRSSDRRRTTRPPMSTNGPKKDYSNNNNRNNFTKPKQDGDGKTHASKNYVGKDKRKPKPTIPPKTEKSFGDSNDNQSSQKRTFKATRKKQFVSKRKQFVEKEIFLKGKKTAPTVATNPIPKSIEIMESISVVDLAKKMNLKASDLLSKLLSMGMNVSNLNTTIDFETAQLLAAEYECEVKVISLYDQTLIEVENEKAEDMVSRPPIVTIMGHVDHGKTTLLDTIRNSDIAKNEQGAITQHIGAYSVQTSQGAITFLDTPGHEAFSLMRERGTQVTDIVVLVIAADDGMKPQTIESIKLIKSAKIPVIVALNKMDAPQVNIDRVLQQLTEHELMPEEWGGEVPVCKISALKNEGIDVLLEYIILQSEMIETKASQKVPGQGIIIETRMEQGKGVVVTLLLKKGTLSIGDSFLAGLFPGKVRDMFDDKGKHIKLALPSMPVEIIGIEGMPTAGDPFQATTNDKIAKQVAMKRQELKRHKASQSVKKVTVDTLYESIEEENLNTLNLIIKGDVYGSVEALKESLEKLSHDEVRVKVISASAGTINSADVVLASTSSAMIIGFNVRPLQQVQRLANQEKVKILRYSVIFDVIDDIRDKLESMLSPVYEEEKIGEAVVREIFSVPKLGIVAGSYIQSGKVERNTIAKVYREQKEISNGKIISLKRFKDDVNSVDTGYECGIVIENSSDLIEGDTIMVYKSKMVARTLS